MCIVRLTFFPVQKNNPFERKPNRNRTISGMSITIAYSHCSYERNETKKTLRIDITFIRDKKKCVRRNHFCAYGNLFTLDIDSDESIKWTLSISTSPKFTKRTKSKLHSPMNRPIHSIFFFLF